MAQITEDFVSFETAKLLKEKGFDVNCYTHYSSDGQNVYYNYQTPSDGINMPTLQMTMKWLREMHKLNIATYPTRQMELVVGKGFVRQYSCNIFNDDEFVQSLEIITGYEKACEAAIKYCLENLV